MQLSFIEEEEEEDEEFKYLLQIIVLFTIDGVSINLRKKTVRADKDQFTLFELVMALIFHKGKFQTTPQS